MSYPHDLKARAVAASDCQPRPPANALVENSGSQRSNGGAGYRVREIAVAGTGGPLLHRKLDSGAERSLIVPMERDPILNGGTSRNAVDHSIRSIRELHRKVSEGTTPVTPASFERKNGAAARLPPKAGGKGLWKIGYRPRLDSDKRGPRLRRGALKRAEADPSA